MKKLRKAELQPLPWLATLLRSEQLRGLRGDPGPQGERGNDGADGRDGVDGRDGAPGRDGERGLQGLQGERGERGLRGSRGPKGDAGKDGERGERGLQGEMGARGPKGDKGDKGDKGNPPKHEIDREKGRIRFERPDGTWGGWLEIKQKVIHRTVNGGGAGINHKVLQDIEALRAGTFPDYGRIDVVTADLTLTDSYRHVVAKTNAVTITLPPAATYYNSKTSIGIIYSITNAKSNANDITLVADGSETIDGASTWTVPPGSSPKVQTDGTEWHIF